MKKNAFMGMAFIAVFGFTCIYSISTVNAAGFRSEMKPIQNKEPSDQQMLKDDFEKMKSNRGMKIQQNGEDVVVSKMLTLNNSPHILKTSVNMEKKGVAELNYTVVQNIDRYKRSQKHVIATWKIQNQKMENVKYELKGNVIVLNNSDINQLVW